ncbi:hypothetical protein Lal_00018965 [Lupinus albus]|nr:hypothetical protein Lal_00018965 [Lupinus albus]
MHNQFAYTSGVNMDDKVEDVNNESHMHDMGEVSFRVRYNFWKNLLVELVLQVIRNTTFGNILDIGTSEINNYLITALIERWWPETHFPFTQWRVHDYAERHRLSTWIAH